MKRAVPGADVPVLGQITWSRFGGAKAAWREAKKRAGLSASVSSPGSATAD